MRINSDTKDALLFMTGLLGIVAQGVLASFGVSPSVPLIGAYLAMCGIAAGSSIFGTRPNGNGDDPPDEQRPSKKRRKARDDQREEPDEG